MGRVSWVTPHSAAYLGILSDHCRMLNGISSQIRGVMYITRGSVKRFVKELFKWLERGGGLAAFYINHVIHTKPQKLGISKSFPLFVRERRRSKQPHFGRKHSMSLVRRTSRDQVSGGVFRETVKKIAE